MKRVLRTKYEIMHYASMKLKKHSVNKLVKGFKDEAEKNQQNTILVNNVFVRW